MSLAWVLDLRRQSAARSQHMASVGTQLKSSGQREMAFAKYQQAVEVCPTYADGFYDLGVYYSEDNQVWHFTFCMLSLCMYNQSL